MGKQIKNDSDISSKHFEVFPNPNNGNFSINTTGIKSSIIQIFNGLGNMIYNHVSQNQNLNIDISNVPNGIYFVKLISGNSIFYNKIIKL